MATGWQSFPIELQGGLVSNLSRLQHGVQAPGSARTLINFEPSIKGGYRRINGFGKYDTFTVPVYGSTVVQASGQSGTSLVVANLFTEPSDGDTFTIAGVTGTYTIASSGVSYSSTNKEATLTLTTSLASGPADQAAVTFTNKTSLIEGLHYFYGTQAGTGATLTYRDGTLWTGTGTDWTNISAPSYGTLLVDGGSQTGTSLVIDGVAADTFVPQIGDTFSIAGVEKVYTVLSVPSITSGGGTVSIYPALASSPANNAAVTMLSMSMEGGVKCRFAEYNYNGTEKFVMVDGTNYPVAGTPTSVDRLNSSTDVLGASVVTSHNDHLFFGAGSKLVFSAPFAENDFTGGNGAGTIQFDHKITGLITFREKLIVFTDSSIHQVSGTSLSDFAVEEISNDLGCSEPDTIREVGGDIMFLGPDGLRFLGATARIGDFNLSLASRQIQEEFTTFGADHSHLVSIVIRDKSQYRIFGFTEGRTSATSVGYLGTQFTDQEASGFNWAQLKGFKAYRTASAYTGTAETLLFAGEDGYVYKMEDGDDFDGETISAYLYTPYLSVEDPRIRKTLYKATTYYDPEGAVSGSLSFRYDFKKPGVIQPPTSDLSGGGTFAFYGAATYGTSTFGGTPETIVETMTTGSFFNVSLEYTFTDAGTAPFIVDTILLEYANNDRK
tara:strand:- start:1383 stop:3380 length:1998 start_codon:yes stop_codon:yes gene_type:complete